MGRYCVGIECCGHSCLVKERLRGEKGKRKAKGEESERGEYESRFRE